MLEMCIFLKMYHEFSFLKMCIYLFLAVLGLRCCTGFSLVAVSGGYSLVAVLELLIAMASLAVGHGLRVHGLQ